MFPRKELSDTIRDVSGEAITTVDRQPKFEKIHRIGFWSAIDNYVRSQQAGGVTKSRKINNRKYLHPVNGIGNSWSHPWSRDREYSVRSSGGNCILTHSDTGTATYGQYMVIV
jgi:hypothetical protein